MRDHASTTRLYWRSALLTALIVGVIVGMLTASKHDGLVTWLACLVAVLALGAALSVRQHNQH